MGLFVDTLIEEVIKHENYIIDENKQPFKLILKNKKEGKTSKTVIYSKSTNYENIYNDIIKIYIEKRK